MPSFGFEFEADNSLRSIIGLRTNKFYRKDCAGVNASNGAELVIGPLRILIFPLAGVSL
jgi:hypothetical protein